MSTVFYTDTVLLFFHFDEAILKLIFVKYCGEHMQPSAVSG